MNASERFGTFVILHQEPDADRHGRLRTLPPPGSSSSSPRPSTKRRRDVEVSRKVEARPGSPPRHAHAAPPSTVCSQPMPTYSEEPITTLTVHAIRGAGADGDVSRFDVDVEWSEDRGWYRFEIHAPPNDIAVI